MGHLASRLSRADRMSAALNRDIQAPVFSPTARASFVWRTSKVQNRSAPTSNAEATCSVSRVARPSRAPYCPASWMHRSNASSGRGPCNQNRDARSRSKSLVSTCASSVDIFRDARCCATACAHSALWSGVSQIRECCGTIRCASVKCRSCRYRETKKLESA